MITWQEIHFRSLLQMSDARGCLQSYIAQQGQLGSPLKGPLRQPQLVGSPKRKGRENSSPNKPRNSPSLQDSVLLKAQLQQAKEDAESDARQWKAALEEEREASQRLQQQLYQLQESDSLVATAAANSQQQVHQLRQQLESEKSRAAVLDANLQVGLLSKLRLPCC